MYYENHHRSSQSTKPSSSSSQPSSETALPTKNELKPEQYVMINIWTAEDDTYLPGHNVGHISIQTPEQYISFWPAPRTADQHVPRDDLPKLKASMRDVSNYFTSRDPNYVQTYRMDTLLEGIHEDQFLDYEGSARRPLGYHLVILNEKTGQIRIADNPASLVSLNEDEFPCWIKPLEANIRIALYSLDISKIHEEFEGLKNGLNGGSGKVEGWSMVGSNILQQTLQPILNFDTKENCASFARRLLKAGGIKSLLSMEQRGSMGSQTASVTTPGILAQYVLKAKHQEQIQDKTHITASWQAEGESDLQELKQIYKISEPPPRCVCM